MRLHHLAIAGFRGFSKPARIEFGAGYTVVSGANGAGKSSICDAIEFALLGRIRSRAIHHEKKETVHDYLWWRGKGGNVSERYVELGMVDDVGREYAIRRTPERLDPPLDATFVSALVSTATAIDDPVYQLCQTSLIRDEDITRLSIDLPEADRFQFVQSALGAADISYPERRGKEVAHALDLARREAHSDYERYRASVAELTARTQQLRSEAIGALGLEEVTRGFQGALGSTTDSLDELARHANQEVVAKRTRAGILSGLYAQLTALSQRLSSVAATEKAIEREQLTQRMQKLEGEIHAASLRFIEARDSLTRATTRAPHGASIVYLQQQGLKIGLVSGRCPLCGHPQSHEAFTKHVTAEAQRIDAESSEAKERMAAVGAAQQQVGVLNRELASIREELLRRPEAENAVAREFGEVSRLLTQYGGTPENDIIGTQQTIGAMVDSLHAGARTLEALLTSLSATRASNGLIEAERELESARAQLAALERRVARVQSAEGVVKDSLQTLRRVQGEMVDEQLASLSPLLLHLFSRLRPHVDWRTVRYVLRGDVRRMLSLEVGDGLNPSFVFSSGQRRAVGLAFLLAIFLSRTWCRFSTLILDDPVQHIDDFRALHLVEVLAAIRKAGRQVVCTVEDEALADLLARRLRVSGNAEGRSVRLGYRSGEGSQVIENVPIPAFARGVLVS